MCPKFDIIVSMVIRFIVAIRIPTGELPETTDAIDAINIYGVHSYTFLRRNMCTSVLISCTMHDSNRSDKIHSNSYRIPTGEFSKTTDARCYKYLYSLWSSFIHILKRKYMHICPKFDTMHDSSRSDRIHSNRNHSHRRVLVALHGVHSCTFKRET